MTGLGGWISAGRSSVQTWECDQMGHMNVQFYVQKAEEAVAFVARALGLGPLAAREANARLSPYQHHIRFHRELRPGTPYWLRAAPVHTDGRFIAIVSEMFNTATGQTAATVAGQYYWTDVSGGARLDLEDHVITRTKDLMQPMPETALERGLTLSEPRVSASLTEAEALGLVTTLEVEVQPDHCDAHGLMRMRDYIGRLSDSIPNLLFESSGAMRAEPRGRIGGAALEYRLIYRKPARCGDLLIVKSGLRSVSEKTYVWSHWLLNAETGDAFATSEAVAISLDLETRRAIAIPNAIRDHLESQIVPGLSC